MTAANLPLLPNTIYGQDAVHPLYIPICHDTDGVD
ncbi:UNVERIFIED_ORG: hypothetical protein BCL66_10658 [Martelella mediterranea]